MKHLITIVYLLIFPFLAVAQSADHKEIKITYEHKFFRVFTTPFVVIVKNGVAQTQYDQPQERKREDGINFSSAEKYYTNNYDMAKRRFSEQSIHDKMKLTAEWDNDFAWEITDETKTIAGYSARKAITDSYELRKDDRFYFGKTYAWFTTDIPVSAGPGRYAGLPGLILEVTYENSSNRYIFKNIEYGTNAPHKDISEGMPVHRDDIFYVYEGSTEKKVRAAYRQSK